MQLSQRANYFVGLCVIQTIYYKRMYAKFGRNVCIATYVLLGDALAAKEVYDELQKDEPNYYLAGALGGAALVGLVPGLGDVAAKAIKKRGTRVTLCS